MLGRLQLRLREAGAISELIPVENHPWMVCVQHKSHMDTGWPTTSFPWIVVPKVWELVADS